MRKPALSDHQNISWPPILSYPIHRRPPRSPRPESSPWEHGDRITPTGSEMKWSRYVDVGRPAGRQNDEQGLSSCHAHRPHVQAGLHQGRRHEKQVLAPSTSSTMLRGRWIPVMDICTTSCLSIVLRFQYISTMSAYLAGFVKICSNVIGSRWIIRQRQFCMYFSKLNILHCKLELNLSSEIGLAEDLALVEVLNIQMNLLI
jgi:hypothetical protein